jgi:SagB-type dehydrogenase family enzyme
MTTRQLRPPGFGGAPGATADPATTQESAGTERTLRLRRDAPLSEPSGAADAVQIATPRGTVLLPGLALGVREAIRSLAREATTEQRLAALVTEIDGEAGLLRMHLALRRLSHTGLLERGLRVRGGQHLAVLRPSGFRPYPETAGAAAAGAAPVRLSRFAVLRAGDGVLVVQAPRSHLVLELAPAAAPLVCALTDWSDPADLTVPGLPGPAVTEVLEFFATAGLLVAGAPGEDSETAGPAAQWSPHDVWLHARSRGMHLSAGYAGTYHLRDKFPPQPAVRPASRAPHRSVALPQPDLAAIARADPPLTEVIEKRRSVREHDDTAPITATQLGELLYRTARIRRVFPGGDGQDLTDHPYPAGGSLGELEVYPLISNCEGLDPGLWRYAADRHGLELIAEPGPEVRALVNTARATSLMRSDPQVVLVVAARFGRLSWKYETISYSLTLKHVGVFYQTVYLVATAMGLAVCGLGGGDADEFARASGCDYYTEGSVGEMIIGRAGTGQRD